MKVDNFPEGQWRYSCPKDFVKSVQLDMDEHGTPHRRLSGVRVSTKSRAPSPPLALKDLDGPGFSQRYPGYPHMTMDQKENLLEKDLNLVVVLPGGVEKTATVHGSKPMMDLLVMLCAKYHLNPSGHTIELVTTNRNHIKFKPNALIGTLEAEKILLKPKGLEDKNKKTGPQMPEATVRLVINYKKTQKTILRVNPRVPLEELLPSICEKCEFDQQTTLLLRDVQSQDPLDLTSCLNDFGIREVYAKDTKGLCSEDIPSSPECPASPSTADTITPGKDKNQKEKENKGLFSLFRKSRKKPEQAMTSSAPASPVLSKPRPLSMASLGAHSSPYDTNNMTDVPKKRRAPLPPILVSQSCPSELSTRQRLHSEPEAQKDRDQVAGLCQGSPTESSLKRTKRKAPPPPMSPTVVVQDDASLDGSMKGGPAPMTLEEIAENEETAASVAPDPGAASDALEDDGSLDLSADVSMDSGRAESHASPDLEVEMQSCLPLESTGEDQSGDLSSDGKLVQSTMDNATESTEPRTQMNSTELVDNANDPCQAEAVCEQTDMAIEDSPAEDGGRVECSSDRCVSPSEPAQPEGTESQASGQPYTEPHTEPRSEESVTSERPAAASIPCPPGEDVQAQTDSAPCSASSPQPAEEVPPSVTPSVSGPTGQKKDMATSTEELDPSDLQPALSAAPEPPPCQAPSPSAPAAAKATTFHAADSEPKPKPSNELTRDYIPKVGMTTYTIVPQKSLEKLRYFEVELTLEAPPTDSEKDADIGSLKLEEQSQVTTVQTEIRSSVSGEDSEQTEGTTVTVSESTVNGSMAAPIHSPSTTTALPAGDDKISSVIKDEAPAGLAAEVKEIKIPPATKPKPGSFRLPQHKRTPGYYVTSAAVKSASVSASPGAGQKEAPANLGREKALQPVEETPIFPPPPPPVQWREESPGGVLAQQSPKEERTRSVPSQQPTRQNSLSVKEPPLGMSLEKLRSFAAPRPYCPSTPSRFAQAVSSAVKRSQSLSVEPAITSPCSPPFYPITGRFSMKEPKGLLHSQGTDYREGEEDKGSAQQGGAEDPRWGSDSDMTARMAGQSQPEQGLGVCAEEPGSNGGTYTFTEPDALALTSPEPPTQE